MNAEQAATIIGQGREKQKGNNWLVPCPCHDDKIPSLSLSDVDGNLLYHCYAGCSQKDVGAELRRRGVLQPGKNQKRKIVKTYSYVDEKGELLSQVCRFEPKDFRQRRPDGNGGWIWKKAERQVPYKLPDVLKSDVVYIPAGEKDCDTLASLGITTTTNAGGENNWHKELTPYFIGKQVVLLPDNDLTGRNHVLKVANLLQNVASSIKIVELPNLPHKGDISDWIKSGRTKQELFDLVKRGKLWQPGAFQVDCDEWPEPQPITSELPQVEKITDEMIPEPFRAWITDTAYRMQVPVDFLAIPLLVVVGSVIGTGCRLKPKQKDDWTVTPHLWGGIVGPPSVLKSPALNETVNKTLGRLEIKAKKQYSEDLQEFDSNSTEDDMRKKIIHGELKKAIKKTIVKEDDEQAEKTVDVYKNKLRQFDDQGQTPTERRFKTNDITIEKTVELLSGNPRGLLIFRDELIGMFKKMEKSGHEQDRAFLLESWNGDGCHVDDRIGRGTIRADNLCLSLLGGIQPDRITSYLRMAVKEHDNDGFVQRLQMLVYPDPMGWDYVDQWPDVEAKNRAYEIIGTLAWMDFTEPVLHFSDDAQELFKKWLTWLQTEKLSSQDDHPIMTEHLAKYRSLMPALALIIHLVDLADGQEPGPVSLQSAKMAAAWCQYLESHARRIYSLALNAGTRAAARLAEKIKAGKLEDGFKRHDIVRKKWALLDDKQSAQEAIDHLLKSGWLREVFLEPGSKKDGRPVAVIYHINPKIFSDMHEN